MYSVKILKLKDYAMEIYIVDDIKYFDSEVSFIDDIIKRGINDRSFRDDINYDVIMSLFYMSLRSILNQHLFVKDKDKWISSPGNFSTDGYEEFVKIYLDGLKPPSDKS